MCTWALWGGLAGELARAGGKGGKEGGEQRRGSVSGSAPASQPQVLLRGDRRCFLQLQGRDAGPSSRPRGWRGHSPEPQTSEPQITHSSFTWPGRPCRGCCRPRIQSLGGFPYLRSIPAKTLLSKGRNLDAAGEATCPGS